MEDTIRMQKDRGSTELYAAFYQKISAKTRKKCMGERLLRLEDKSKVLYNILNALFGLLLKPIPIVICLHMLMLNSGIQNVNISQNALKNFFKYASVILLSFEMVIIVHVIAIGVYIGLLIMDQFLKIFLCTYKPLVIRFRVFDQVIKVSKKKILASNDKDTMRLLRIHEELVEKRNKKRKEAMERAAEKKRPTNDKEDLNT